MYLVHSVGVYNFGKKKYMQPGRIDLKPRHYYELCDFDKLHGILICKVGI